MLLPQDEIPKPERDNRHGRSTSGAKTGNDFPGRALWLQLAGNYFMRSGCLWLIGVPIPIIILLWLITGHA
jgi:hypothetical protein